MADRASLPGEGELVSRAIVVASAVATALEKSNLSQTARAIHEMASLMRAVRRRDVNSPDSNAANWQAVRDAAHAAQRILGEMSTALDDLERSTRARRRTGDRSDS